VPVLGIASGVSQVQNIEYHGSTTPDAAPVYGIATRQPHTVMFDSGDKGETAYHYARWITRSGLVAWWSAMAQHSR
jgi:hypothetical protein